MSAIQRMIDEMQRRGYASKTIKEYSASLRRLSSHFACCPSKLSLQQVREYQLHLAKREDISASYYNSTVTALRFLYLQTLGRDWSIERLPYGRREHPSPVVLSRQEVFQLWRPQRELRRRVLLMTAYSAALRTSELVQVACGPHLAWIDAAHRKRAATYQPRDLLAVELVVFLPASMNCLHVQGVAEQELDTLFETKIGQPVPGEHAFGPTTKSSR